MNKLTKVKLSDVADIIGGGTPDTKKQEFWNGNIPWITPKDLSSYNYRYISNGERNITKKGLENSSARILPQGSILLTSRAPIGYIAIAQNELCTNQGFKSLILKENNCPLFFYYLLKNNIKYIINMSSGSTFPEISGSQVKNLEFNIPDLTTQEKIARVLSSLDDKIELNNKINQNLEQQADLLFNDLFLEDKDCIKLSEVISTTSGGTPSRKNLNFYTNGSFCWVKSKELNGTFITKTEEKINQLAIEKSSAKLLPPYSVLLAMYGATVGEYAIISKEMTCNQAICAIIPNEKYPYTYIYEYIKLSKEKIKTLAIGSAQQNISQVLIKDLPVHKNINKIKEYHFKTRNLFELIKNNQIENEKLKQLRDTLLPKLMSGEIDVNRVEV